MSRRDYDNETRRVADALRAESDRVQRVLERATRRFGSARLDEKRKAKARALREEMQARKAERKRRADRVPKSLHQQCKQHKTCLDNLKGTIAALERRQRNGADVADRLAEMLGRLAAAESRVQDAEKAVDDAFDLPMSGA